MPTSDWKNLNAVVQTIQELAPQFVLDLGIGFGKYGVLAREYLDALYGRCKPETWLTTIHGVEGFEAYRNPAWGVYNKVFIEDFSAEERLDYYDGYDLVLLLDSLEHVEKDRGMVVLSQLCKKNKAVLVSVPDGEYEQGAIHGNEYERHRATWTGKELFMLGGSILSCGLGSCAIALFKGWNP